MAENLIKIPLVLSPQPEGGYTVTSPLVPELLTEGDTPEEVMENLKDAIQAVIELYEDLGKPIPPGLIQASSENAIKFEYLAVG